MIEFGLVLARAFHYFASLVLFGVMIFPLYAYAGHLGPIRPTNRWLLATAGWAAFAALLSGSIWLASVVASMTGSLDSVVNWEAVRFVLTETSLGKVWMIRTLVVAVILILITVQIKSITHQHNWLLVALCAGLLASLAGTGHARMHEGLDGIIHTIADGLHLLAAGAWLGGLVSLYYLVAKARRTVSPPTEVEACSTALRFSGMGYVAAATLIASGLINSWFLVGPFGNLMSTPYGRILLVKLLLFVGMLGLAAWNRFLIVPKLTDTNEFGPRLVQLRKLGRHVLGEQALGLLVILAVSLLGTMEPAINISSQ